MKVAEIFRDEKCGEPVGVESRIGRPVADQEGGGCAAGSGRSQQMSLPQEECDADVPSPPAMQVRAKTEVVAKEAHRLIRIARQRAVAGAGPLVENFTPSLDPETGANVIAEDNIERREQAAAEEFRQASQPCGYLPFSTDEEKVVDVPVEDELAGGVAFVEGGEFAGPGEGSIR